MRYTPPSPAKPSPSPRFPTPPLVRRSWARGSPSAPHVGLDTVKLKGEHYTVHVKNGDKVKKGDLLIEFDPAAISAAGFDVITPMVICNTPNYTKVEIHSGKTVAPGDLVIELGK